MNYDIDKIFNEIDFDMHVSVGNLFLSHNQMKVLDKYKIRYKDCLNISELLFNIEEYLNNEIEEYSSDLEIISAELSETNYYMNTNK